MYAGYGATGWDYIFSGPGLSQLEAYLVIIFLGCVGYGAVFLLLSLMFRNPTPAAMMVMGWEAINPVLPSVLQKISVASYLRHLMPITVPGSGIFALLTVQSEPVAGWVRPSVCSFSSSSSLRTPASEFAGLRSDTPRNRSVSAEMLKLSGSTGINPSVQGHRPPTLPCRVTVQAFRGCVG